MINGQTRLVSSWIFFKKAQVFRGESPVIKGRWVDIGSRYDVLDDLCMGDAISVINDSEKSSSKCLVVSEIREVILTGRKVDISFKSDHSTTMVFSDKEKTGEERAKYYFDDLMDYLNACNINFHGFKE